MLLLTLSFDLRDEDGIYSICLLLPLLPGHTSLLQHLLLSLSTPSQQHHISLPNRYCLPSQDVGFPLHLPSTWMIAAVAVNLVLLCTA